ncbi:Hpt domain-containing protein [Ramlibacter sp. 2FC]|uniref:hybrid sensor histidine kinase/response regulator n=1 Tax=Ramlibacter sp. 2FC TaxID=2502188 RepID=UPI0010FA4E5C|nr:Hpt domain-containing protein [Ramlibacter sp. 2FC]
MSVQALAETAESPAASDLGPLAWVLDELRKSLEGATKSLRRFVRDTTDAAGADLMEVDAGPLRLARQQLHQAAGALEMADQAVPARLLRAMEAAAQRFVQQPAQCSEAAAGRVERAGFALIEYLEGVLAGKPVAPVGLFPPYREVQELAGAERIHPADLWPLAWRWTDPALPLSEPALASAPALRARLDQGILKLMKSGDLQAAAELGQISLGLARGQQALQPRVFWQICAGFFEALSRGALRADAYVKRSASRILLQYATLAQGDPVVSDRLAQDLLFFCAQALPAPDSALLPALDRAWALGRCLPGDYEQRRYGQYDPALRVQARKRVDALKDLWSALAGGDLARLQQAVDQLGLVADSLQRLVPGGAGLARALNQAGATTLRSGRPPSAELGMEVATSVLYLEAMLADLDPSDAELAERCNRLAARLDRVCEGGGAPPLEPWMEALYRQVSDRQTMGTVVGELHLTLGEAEKLLDQYFRQPAEAQPLHAVPGLLSQMRGVLSVLGLEQASQAVLRMRDSVEQLLMGVEPAAGEPPAALYERLGNSLGALGFLIDMLGYQPALAKKLFVYDAQRGELRPLMGRQAQPSPAAAPTVAELAPVPQAAPVAPEPAPARFEPPAADDELREIFLDEAREVVSAGLDAVQALAQAPGDLEQQTTLRRAFHTLKGSSRMVGLAAFGEAAWSLEQLLNAWLAEQKPVSPELGGLCEEALQGFGRWVEDIADGRDAAWQPAMFSRAADLFRLERKRVPLDLPAGAPVPTAPAAAQPLVEEDEEEALGWADTQLPEPDEETLDFALAPQPIEPLLAETLVWPPSPAPQEAAPAVPEPSAFELPPLELGLPEPAAPPAEPAPQPEAVETAPAASLEVSDIDFEAFVQATQPPVPEALPMPEPAAAELPPDLEGVELVFEAPAAAEPVASALPDFSLDLGDSDTAAGGEALVPEAESDEQYKRIGALRIGIPLYNVYLNEADEWSRRLSTELSEWSMEPHRPAPESAVALAHSLAGSSATVGFEALSGLARRLEHALERLQGQAGGSPAPALLFLDVAEDLRRLLHQFAAGFLKEPNPALIEALERFEATGELPAAAEAAPVEPAFQAAPVEPSPAAVTLVDEEDFDLVDAVDPELLAIFEEEAGELMPQLGSALRQWVARPDNSGARAEVLRALHTLKGSARLAGAFRLGEQAHRMESAIEALGSQALTSEQIEPLLGRFDAMEASVEQLRHAVPAPVAAPEPAPQAAVPLPAAPAALAASAVALPAALQPVPASVAAGQAVRVRAQLLDRLVVQAGEVMITRSRLEAELGQLRGSLQDLTGNLERLRQQLRDVELQAETQMQSRLAQAQGEQQNFDPLEFDRFTRVQELTRMMAESVNDVATVQRALQRTVQATEDDLQAQARQTRELQRGLLRTRMVEFEGISERLYRVVRQAAKDTGKQVKLDITGGAIEMDRGVLERMTPAFEHLLRNCVAHGIESPEARQAAGKAPAGTVTIALHQEGNDVAVVFRDDGAGLDLGRIRAKAQLLGLITADQELGEAETTELIYRPGFSTADALSELAGRGIGMDVVRAEVQGLGGRIETHSQPGQGTAFRLVLPLTTAVTQVLLVRAGELTVGLPANVVELVRRSSLRELQQAYNSGQLAHDGESLPFFWAGALLQSSVRSHEAQTKSPPVVVLRSAAQRLAMHVDQVIGNQEVVVKNLGPQLSRLPGLAGMTVLPSGTVALIYNPVALASVYGEQVRALSADQAQPEVLEQLGAAPAVAAEARAQAPLVLVVDDSITVRRVMQRMLQREGWRVALAVDGLQALERLQEERPAVVLSDIEMPRMDGFDLVRNIRHDPRLAELPVIMITSRIAAKHREHARELGVDHYLGKPYSEEELLGLVRRYAPLETDRLTTA